MAQATAKDLVLARVLQSVVSGRNTLNAMPECRSYMDFWDELSTEGLHPARC